MELLAGLFCGLLFFVPLAWCGWILLRDAWATARARDPSAPRTPGYLPLSPRWFAIGVMTAVGVACLAPLLTLLYGLTLYAAGAR